MSDAEKLIRQYLARSAGNCNYISNHTLDSFVGMLESGEALASDFIQASGIKLLHKVWRRQSMLDQKRMREKFRRDGKL